MDDNTDAASFDPDAARGRVDEIRGAYSAYSGRTGDSQEDFEQRLKDDFRLFLIVVWRQLGLPDPTPLQLAMAWWLQHGPERSITMGFRGVAKSWITAAFCLWLLYRDPQKKILVVSGSLKRAVAFTNFCLSLIREMPLLHPLRPGAHQRQSSQAFDVGPATPDQNPSFHAAGVSSQLPGFRADAIVPDDVETNTNSLTVLMREKIRDAVKEFDSILKPNGIVRFLGTPHDYDSLYNHLAERGYTTRTFPARFPDETQRKIYGDRLSPFYLHELKKDPAIVGQTAEPTRFTEKDLTQRALSLGKSEFALQFMLDTSLSDANKFPLKLADLSVMGMDPRRGPDLIAWGKGDTLLLKDLPCLGFEGDFYYSPANMSESYSPYNKVVGAIDSSGRGDDETALAIVAELNALLHLQHCSGYRDGYSPKTLTAIAQQLVRYNVQELKVESNFGDGMFVSLLQPYVVEAWRKHNKNKPSGEHGGTEIEEIRSPKVQKEQRILSIMEPVTQQHRMVVNREVIEDDYKNIRSSDAGEETRHRYGLMHQWTHLTRERDCLAHDDRLEAVSIACSVFAEVLGVSPLGMAMQKEDDKLEEELERLFADADDVGDWGIDRHRREDRVGMRRPANLQPGIGHRS